MENSKNCVYIEKGLENGKKPAKYYSEIKHDQIIRGSPDRKYESFAHHFYQAADNFPDGVVLRYEKDHAHWNVREKEASGIYPQFPSTEWFDFTYTDYKREAQEIARANIAAGLEPQDCAAVWGFNNPHYHFATMGTILSGGISMGIYPTDKTKIASYKLLNSEVKIIFVEGEKQLKQLEKICNDKKTPFAGLLEHIVVWNPDQDLEDYRKIESPVKLGEYIKVHKWDEYTNLGTEIDISKIITGKEDGGKEDAAGRVVLFVYTSGTTGYPKACMITNDNVVFTASNVFSVFEESLSVAPQHRIVSYLPLSHIAAFTVDIVSPIMVASEGFGNESGGRLLTVNCARNYDLKPVKFSQDGIFQVHFTKTLQTVKPTIFFAVPALYKKFEETLKRKAQEKRDMGCCECLCDAMKQCHPIKAIKECCGWLFVKQGCSEDMKALKKFEYKNNDKGKTVNDTEPVRTSPNCNCDGRILDAILAKLGFEEVKLFASGGAAISKESQEYFASIGVNICNVWGMSETCGCSSYNTPQTYVIGSIGCPLTDDLEFTTLYEDEFFLDEKTKTEKIDWQHRRLDYCHLLRYHIDDIQNFVYMGGQSKADAEAKDDKDLAKIFDTQPKLKRLINEGMKNILNGLKPGFDKEDMKSITDALLPLNKSVVEKAIQEMIKEKDGVLAVRGRSVMMGYLNQKKKTESTFNSNGYLITGDRAKVAMPLNGTEFWQLCARVKNIIVPESGENVAPADMEAWLSSNKETTDLVSQVVLVGDEKPHIAALVVLNTKESCNLELQVKKQTIAKREGKSNVTEDVSMKDFFALQNQKDSNVVEIIKKVTEHINNLPAEKIQNNAWKIKQFTILPYSFSVVGNELTPSFKLKRKVVIEYYQELMNEMYKEHNPTKRELQYVRCPPPLYDKYTKEKRKETNSDEPRSFAPQSSTRRKKRVKNLVKRRRSTN